jgi:hypothetical protein
MENSFVDWRRDEIKKLSDSERRSDATISPTFSKKQSCQKTQKASIHSLIVDEMKSQNDEIRWNNERTRIWLNIGKNSNCENCQRGKIFRLISVQMKCRSRLMMKSYQIRQIQLNIVRNQSEQENERRETHLLTANEMKSQTNLIQKSHEIGWNHQIR